ncbi:MAG TPA: calcineurin-like phosphoesterase C-terminal domain-containing protein, partial [Hyphomicrobium sp.]|nr:calcineurin-like phosphoesterase C-terminal domain-containing protein [Hyphomicrobium sp.]
ETGMPWYHCPGNHDMNLDSSTPAYAFEAWKQAMGCTHSAFQYAGATFFLLNNVEYFGRGGAAADGRGYRGFIGQDQIDFIANVLRHVPQDQLIVVSMHIPLVSFESPNSISDTTADRRALLRLLSGRPNTVSFSGHSHTTEHHYLGRADGFDRDTPHHHHVLTAACGSWWSGVPDARGVPISDSRDGTPKGIHVLSVDGNRYTTRLVTSPCAGASPLRAMIAKLPAQSAVTERLEDHLVVDVFDGGPRTRVSCHSPEFGERPMAMDRIAIADPHIVESFARHKALSKPWVAPAPSSHIWTLPLPAAFDGRTLDVTVQVKSEFGETYEIRQVLARRMPAGEHLRI